MIFQNFIALHDRCSPAYVPACMKYLHDRENSLPMTWLDWFAKDPLASYAIFEHSPAVHHLGAQLGLPYLHLHLHEMLYGFVFYTAIYYLTGPVLRLTTKWYAKLTPSKRSGVATHVVSEVNAILMLVLAFPMFFLPELATPNQRIAELAKLSPVLPQEAIQVSIDSIVAYQPYGAFVVSIISGYFLFDVYVTMWWLKDNGLGFALHAVAALFTFMQGSRAYMLSFGAPFLWYEASTPFVNLHWLASNVPGLVSKKVETINGAILILVFFICRIVAGSLNGYQLFSYALRYPLPNVPSTIVYFSFFGYALLHSLNFFWFGKMVTVAYSVLFGSKTKKSSAGEANGAVNGKHRASSPVNQATKNTTAGSKTRIRSRKV